jgi:5-methylcytosine-specific restriction endonuclease McrA
MIFHSKMTYKDQLKTSAWLRKKYEILSRDNFTCSVCLCDNFESKLEVHHIAYFKDGRKAWEYMDYMLVTLCRECHQKEHDDKNIHNRKKIIEWIVKLLDYSKTNAKLNRGLDII